MPSLFFNGQLLKTGQRTGRIVHPGIGSPDGNVRFVHFEGDNTEPQLIREALTEDRIRTLAASLPEPNLPPPLEVVSSSRLPLWENGRYTLQRASGRTIDISVSGISAPTVIEGPWRVRFQPNPAARGGHRVFVDLGRVEVLAQVLVNGKDVGVLWKPPYRADITDAVRARSPNDLEVRVTTLWPNRLIGDEQLPEEYAYGSAGGGGFGNQAAIRQIPSWFVEGKPKPPGQRVTFTTWKHWRRDSPLLAAGPLGPVRVLTATMRSIEA